MNHKALLVTVVVSGSLVCDFTSKPCLKSDDNSSCWYWERLTYSLIGEA